MEAMFRSLFTFIVTGADTLTMGMLSLNHLARGAVERTVVVEKKAVAAAALSQLDNINTVAERLREINDAAAGIDDESFKKAAEFIQDYQAAQSRMADLPAHLRGIRGRQSA